MSAKRQRFIIVLVVLAVVAAAVTVLLSRRSVDAVWIEGEPPPEADRTVGQRGAGEVLRARCGSETGSDRYVLSPHVFKPGATGPAYEFTLQRPIANAKVVFRYARDRVVVEFADVGVREYSGGAKIDVTVSGPGGTRTATGVFASTGGVGVVPSQWRLAEVNLGRLEAGRWTLSMAGPAEQDAKMPPLHTIVLDGLWIVPGDVKVGPEETGAVDRIRCSNGGWFGLVLPPGDVNQKKEAMLRVVVRRFDGRQGEARATLNPASGPRSVLPMVEKKLPEQDLGLTCYDVTIPPLPDGPYTLQVSATDLAGEIEVPMNLFGDFLSLIAVAREQLRTVAASLEGKKGPTAIRCRADLEYIAQYVNDNCSQLAVAGDPKAVQRRIGLALKQAKETVRRLMNKEDPYAGRSGNMWRASLGSDGRTLLPYRVFVPEKVSGDPKSVPLVVMIHGGGNTEDFFPDLDGGAVDAYLNDRGWMMVSPRMTGWPAGPERKGLLDLIAAAQREYPNVDPRRIFVVGHSRGGWGAYETAAEHPDLFAAVACIAGVTDPSLTAKLKDVPLLLVHGRDDTTVPPETTTAVAERMKSLGYPCRLQLLDGRGHELAGHSREFLDPVFAFFDEQARGQ